MAIDFRSILNSGAFTRQQAEALVLLINAAVSEASGGTVAWGGISGSLPDQTDLQAELDAINGDIGTLTTAVAGKEDSFSKGSLIQGAGVTLTGTLTGRLVGAGDVEISAGASSGWTYVVLGSDFTTGSTSPQATDLLFTPAANTAYEVEAKLLISSSVNTTAAQPGIDWPATGPSMDFAAANIYVPQTASGLRFDALSKPDGASGATSIPTTSDIYLATLDAYFKASTVSTNFIVTLESEVASSNVTLKAGSFIRYRIVA